MMHIAQQQMQRAEQNMKAAQAELIDAKNRESHVAKEEQALSQINQNKMKNYFKQTNIYGKYVQEYTAEQAEHAKLVQKDEELAEMKEKMDYLQKKYTKL
jgi:hypothetical protein